MKIYSRKDIQEIRDLRRRGFTYTEIRQSMGRLFPQSTLSYICRGVSLPIGYDAKVRKLNLERLQQFRKIAVESNRRKRLKYVTKLKGIAREAITDCNFGTNVFKLILAVLYLGEGGKHSRSGLSLGSSDLGIILLYLSLLERCYGIDRQKLHYRISYRADQNLLKLQEYWAKILGVPIENFYHSIPDPRTKGKRTLKLNYKGVCVVSGGGSRVKLELQFLAEAFINNISGIMSFKGPVV